MLRVFNISEVNHLNPAAAKQKDPPLIKVSYRFVMKEKAVLRYGPPYNPTYRGEDVPGTFCDKYFEDCDTKNCKVQSPNYPGLYPRNITCYYHIRQIKIPDGKVALIQVSQKNPHLIYVKDKNTPQMKRQSKLMLGNSCHILHDYIMIFDGNTTSDLVLLKACKGSSLSPIITSGPNLLLMFHASAYDFPFQDSPRRRVFGFQLDINVQYFDRESTAYIPRPNSQKPTMFPTNSYCQWTISSKGQRSGYLQAPAHSLSKNTTCVWRMVASNTEVVWLYFLHYRHVTHREMPQPRNNCSNDLSIFDGEDRSDDSTLFGNFCSVDEFPRVCSEVNPQGREGGTGPCPPEESYVSQSNALTLSLNYRIGTTPAHIKFLAKYEFVDKKQWGDPDEDNHPCNRIFTSRPDRKFLSPKDVFLFGRGGRRSLRCTYTFRAATYQKIALRIYRSRMGSDCITMHQSSSQRYECININSIKESTIKIDEELSPGLHIPRACVCNSSEVSPIIINSYTNELKLRFSISHMSAFQDYNDFFFEGDYEIIEPEETCKLKHSSGRFGNFTMGRRSQPSCHFYPRWVSATDGAFLLLQIPGSDANLHACKSDSRVNIFAVEESTPIMSVCPGPSEKGVHIFSSGWKDNMDHDEISPGSSLSWSQNFSLVRPKKIRKIARNRDLLVEHVGNMTGEYFIQWMSVWKPIHTAPISSVGVDICPHRCHSIEACIPKELWCDGVFHCSSYEDESAGACGILAALPWLPLVVVLALFVTVMLLLAAVMRHRKNIIERQNISQNNDIMPSIVDSPTCDVLPSLQSNGLKSTTQDFLIPPDKEDAW